MDIHTTLQRSDKSLALVRRLRISLAANFEEFVFHLGARSGEILESRKSRRTCAG
jgi:hypothetical protein